MGIIGAIVAAVVGALLAIGVGVFGVQALTETPPAVQTPLIDYYGER